MADVLKIGAYVFPPYVNPCFVTFPKNCSNPGWDILYLHYQLQGFGFNNFKYINININKKDPDFADMFQNGEIDISGITQEENIDKFHNDITMTTPAFTDQHVFVAKDTIYTVVPNLLFQYCPLEMWLFVLFTMLLVMVFKYCYSYLHKKIFISSTHILADEIPYLVWSLAFGVFLAIYSQYLGLTLTMFLRDEKQFSNFGRLIQKVESGECKLFTTEFSSGYLTDTNVSSLRFTKVDNLQNMIKTVNRGRCNIGFCFGIEYLH